MKLLSLALLACLLVAGCATSQPLSDQRVALSPDLPHTVGIENLSVGRNSGGLLVVNAALVNEGNREQAVNYRVTWLAGGTTANTVVGSWQRRTLRPREPFFFSLQAPQLAVDDFRLIVRPAE